MNKNKIVWDTDYEIEFIRGLNREKRKKYVEVLSMRKKWGKLNVDEIKEFLSKLGAADETKV